jgi:signal transduction histidine kinase
VSAESEAVVLTVSNSSSNLLPRDMRRVFDRFWRADSSHQRTEETHCGLGLPLCKALVERLGGTIGAIASAAGVFTVAVRLPSADHDAQYRTPPVHR